MPTPKRDPKTIAADAQRIEDLGGPAEVSRKAGVSLQCAFNWKARGIPAAVKLQFPGLFLHKLRKTKAQAGQGA